VSSQAASTPTISVAAPAPLRSVTRPIHAPRLRAWRRAVDYHRNEAHARPPAGKSGWSGVRPMTILAWALLYRLQNAELRPLARALRAYASYHAFVDILAGLYASARSNEGPIRNTQLT
jgi:hypothetical protein